MKPGTPPILDTDVAGGCRLDPDPDLGMILYATGRNEFLIPDKATLPLLQKMFSDSMNLQTEIAAFRESPRPMDEKREEEAGRNEENFERVFEVSDSKAADAIQEILMVRRNAKGSVVHDIRYISKKSGGKFSWAKPGSKEVEKIKNALQWTTEDDEKKFNRNAKRRAARKGGTEAPEERKEQEGPVRKEAKIKAVLAPGFSISNAGGNPDLPWPLSVKSISVKPDGQMKADTAAGSFELSPEAQLLRFTAGVETAAEIDLSEGKISIGGHGYCSFGLAEGKIEGKWMLPCEAGFDLLALLVLTDKARSAIVDGKKLVYRFGLSLTVEGFVGARLDAALSLPSLDAKERTGEVGASGSAFAGATGSVTVEAMLAWNPIASGAEVKKTEDGGWCVLTKVGGELAGSAGAGIQGIADIAYENGKFHFRMGAAVCWGLGGKAAMSFEVDARSAIEIATHILDCIDWHRTDALGTIAFQAVLNMQFWMLVKGVHETEHLAHAGAEKLSQVKDWVWGIIHSHKDQGESQRDEIRRNLVKVDLPQVLPEVRGRIMASLIELESAVNNYDQASFDVILHILDSASSAHEFKWMVRHCQFVLEPDSGDETAKDQAFSAGKQNLKEHGQDQSGYNAYMFELEKNFSRYVDVF